MPSKPSHSCSYARCPNLAAPGSSYCETHKKQAQKQQDQQRGSSTARGYDYLWRKVRQIKLNHDPLCEQCRTDGHLTPANEVHHIDGNPQNNIMGNLMSLCHSCHSRITSTMQGFARES